MSNTKRSDFSNSRSPERSSYHPVERNQPFIHAVPSQNPLDSPQLDPKSQYSISYVPRKSEHSIDPGNNLGEAQFKIVLLACEVERLSGINYKLVKENEILRTRISVSDREKDLETKLAIVLAENEKLN
mmetsp:Transcript_20285/g.17509  ORF Transcript_20285/g.17509 Transcript_20285/m.17509 type:complete len:129 (-) Transcript_20285:1560-1946(-)